METKRPPSLQRHVNSVVVDTPARKPASRDDIQSVSALDAAESRARAALRIAEEERQRADDAESRAASLENVLDRVTAIPDRSDASLPVVDKTDLIGDKISVSPSAVTVHRSGKKYVIPFAIIMAIAPLIWTLTMDYIEMKRQVREQTRVFSSTTDRIDKLEQKLSEQSRDSSSLRETVAQISGYLSAVLPKAGVIVPVPTAGAARVNLVSDPIPIGALRPDPVQVRTPVPTPSRRDR